MTEKVTVGVGVALFLAVWGVVIALMGGDAVACFVGVFGAAITMMLTVFILVPYGILKVHGGAKDCRKATRRTGKITSMRRFGSSIVFSVEGEVNTYLSRDENPNVAAGDFVSFKAPDLYATHILDCYGLCKVENVVDVAPLAGENK